MENKIAIYLLTDPRKPQVIRYVGQAKAPRVRHLQHCAETATSPKGEWIETMRQEGIMPQMIVVEWVNADRADESEKLWIARFQQDLLTNKTAVVLTAAAMAVKGISHERKPTSIIGNLRDAQKDAIIETLNKCGWNKLEAAKRLGIGRQTLYNKLKDFGITEPKHDPLSNGCDFLKT